MAKEQDVNDQPGPTTDRVQYTSDDEHDDKEM